MKKDQTDLESEVVWVSDSKYRRRGSAAHGRGDRGVSDQMQLAGNRLYLFPSDDNATGPPARRA